MQIRSNWRSAATNNPSCRALTLSAGAAACAQSCPATSRKVIPSSIRFHRWRRKPTTAPKSHPVQSGACQWPRSPLDRRSLRSRRRTPSPSVIGVQHHGVGENPANRESNLQVIEKKESRFDIVAVYSPHITDNTVSKGLLWRSKPLHFRRVYPPLTAQPHVSNPVHRRKGFHADHRL